MVDRDLVTEELKRLIGLPLQKAGRASDLVWFGFGNFVKIEDKRHGGYREVAEYSLHIQCAWRITDFEKIITGSSDRFIPNSQIKDYEEFNWDVQNANRCDEQLKVLLDKLSTDLIVKDVTVNKFGDAKIFFNDDYLLEVIPDNSTADEAWRLFNNGGDTEHLVITGTGVNLE